MLWFWVVAGPLLAGIGMRGELVALGARNAFAPLWFLAVYLTVAASVPLLLALHDRLGLWLPVGLTALVAAVDAAHHEAGVPLVGNVNFFAIWAVPTVLGFCWHDGMLHGRGIRWALPFAAAVLLVLLVTRLGYPVSLVGVDDAERSNNAPPSLALASLAWAQLGIAVAARAPATRWLERAVVWRAVGGLNVVAMTVFLWHITVMVLAVAALDATVGWPERAPLSGLWWALRPAWLVALAAVLAGVVALLAPVEVRSPEPQPPARGAATALPAAVAVAVAVAALVVLMAVGALPGAGAALLPPACALAVTAAAVALGAFRSEEAHERAGGRGLP